MFARVANYYFGLIGRSAAYLNICISAFLLFDIILPSPPLGRPRQFTTSLSSRYSGWQRMRRSKIQNFVSSWIRTSSLMQVRCCRTKIDMICIRFAARPPTRSIINEAHRCPISIFMSDDATWHLLIKVVYGIVEGSEIEHASSGIIAFWSTIQKNKKNHYELHNVGF